MIKLPLNSKWTQPNVSDKFGSLAYTKNCNLDEAGYIKLSPRTVAVSQEDRNADLGIPVAIGRFAEGEFLVGTSSDSNFNGTLSTTENDWDENSGSNEPTMTQNSHACWYNGLWLASTATAVLSRPATTDETEAWTSRITGLTSGKRHYLAVFASRNTITVTDANTVKQYDSSYASSVTLTIPSDFEAIATAYNNSRLAVLTRLGTSSAGQDQQARLYIWDGTTTGAQTDHAIGSDAGVAICAYKSSFAILTRAGQLLYWNGGGFQELAAFPFYYTNKQWGSILSNCTLGESMRADGDVIYINVGLEFNTFGRKAENALPETPSGVWCYDPEVGLYHRWSGSLSLVHATQVTDANLDTTTDIFTTSGTIPATGGIARLSSASTVPGGLTLFNDYYIIKLGSTTFQLAETKEKALLGIYIDITSKGSGGITTFWMYDLKDYGNSFHDQGSTGAGAVGIIGETSPLYQDVIFGGDYGTTSLVANDAVCVAIPFLENRGYCVTPKVFSRQVKDDTMHFYVKFRPLKSSDSIVIKYRDRDLVGLPTASSGKSANWTSDNEFYTTQDCSEAKTYLDAGGSIEVEFISGAGGGQMVQVTSMGEGSGTYSFVLADSVLGASAGLKAEFILMNWKPIATATDSDNTRGYKEVGVKLSSKWTQLKIEMRGSDICIEDVVIDNKVNV